MKRLATVAVLIGPLLLFILAERSLKRGLQPGDLLPEARLESLDGVAVQTASWRGAPTLLVLFLPACPACQEEIHRLESIAPQLPAVRIVLLSLDGEAPREQVTFPVLRDPHQSFVQRTRKLLIPTLYWIDSTGKIRYARTGLRSPASDLNLLRSLLEEIHD
jgi:peroxiredoxin